MADSENLENTYYDMVPSDLRTTTTKHNRAEKAGGAVVALTFDDGPGANTAALLSILEREAVPATFFLIGEHAARHPELVKAICARGHQVENHTWSHPHLPTLTPGQIRDEIAKADDAIMRGGAPRPQFVRPPYGEYDSRVVAALANSGKGGVMWTIDSEDWTMQANERTIERATSAQPGFVILLHDFVPQTITAVPEIIRRLRNRGFSFATVGDLVACNPSVYAGSMIFSQSDCGRQN